MSKNKIVLLAGLIVILFAVLFFSPRSNNTTTIQSTPSVYPTITSYSLTGTPLITSGATHAVITFGNPTLAPTIVDNTNTRQTACRQAGGSWREFPNTCADKCSQPACGEANVDSCDCGKDRCWDGNTCVPNDPNSDLIY